MGQLGMGDSHSDRLMPSVPHCLEGLQPLNGIHLEYQ